jgi:alkyl hydroperoxide reductase subunit AhpC
VCPTEIIAFSDRVAEFSAINANVACWSTDTEHCHLAWIQTPRNKGGLGKMQIPVIADVTKSISKAYGVLVDTEGDDMQGLALRGTVIIDPKGIVRAVSINDAPAGRSVDETLRVLQALQYADEHGEVCPANWKPGKQTMKPTKDGVAAYLSTATA